MLTPLRLHHHTRPSHCRVVPILWSVVWAIGFSAGLSALALGVADASTVSNTVAAIEIIQLSQPDATLHRSRGYEPPKDLGLPMRREPGGTR